MLEYYVGVEKIEANLCILIQKGLQYMSLRETWEFAEGSL